jgi:hypothetical protein
VLATDTKKRGEGVDGLFKSTVLLFLATFLWVQIDTRADGLFKFLGEHGYSHPGLIGDLVLLGVVLTFVYIVLTVVKAFKK